MISEVEHLFMCLLALPMFSVSLYSFLTFCTPPTCGLPQGSMLACHFLLACHPVLTGEERSLFSLLNSAMASSTWLLSLWTWTLSRTGEPPSEYLWTSSIECPRYHKIFKTELTSDQTCCFGWLLISHHDPTPLQKLTPEVSMVLWTLSTSVLSVAETCNFSLSKSYGQCLSFLFPLRSSFFT